MLVVACILFFLMMIDKLFLLSSLFKEIVSIYTFIILFEVSNLLIYNLYLIFIVLLSLQIKENKSFTSIGPTKKWSRAAIKRRC